MKVFKAPQDWSENSEEWEFKVFLAGSIEMGKAENWQDKVTEFFSKTKWSDRIIVLNPRRDDWDSSWTQSIDNPQFNEQVSWELTAQENANLIIMYFDPNTKSPITLLELGLFKDSNIVVCCPKEFWRRGNVEMVCDRYDIPLTDNMEDFLKQIYKNMESQL